MLFYSRKNQFSLKPSNHYIYPLILFVSVSTYRFIVNLGYEKPESIISFDNLLEIGDKKYYYLNLINVTIEELSRFAIFSMYKNKILSFIFSCTFFVLIHLTNCYDLSTSDAFAFLSIVFFLGCLGNYCFLYAKSILLAIVLHNLFNIFQFVGFQNVSTFYSFIGTSLVFSIIFFLTNRKAPGIS